MKITFYSNFLNHHQLPFCIYMYEALGNDFVFVANEKIPDERLEMKYRDMNNSYPFVLRTYEGQKQYELALSLAKSSDAIILGSAPNEFVDVRLSLNKLTFRYSERLFKKGIFRRFIPQTRLKVFNAYTKYANKNFYVLCASAYTAYDLSLCGMQDNTYKWGYFPEVKEYDISELFSKKIHNTIELLWVGRFLNWKHPQDAIKVAYNLKEENIPFHLNIIGSGEQEKLLKKLVNSYNLTHCVDFLRAMSPEKVREYMERANIFLFTSDFQEGWGAVLNEAMNSGCAIVASHTIGSVPYLLKHDKNGLIYRYGNHDDFYNKVKYLIDNPKKQQDLGKAAYQTLFNTWNANISANRLLQLIDGILSLKEIYFDDGPCSKAPIIKNNWYKQ